MNDRSKKLQAIFHSASELGTPEERELYLNEACAGDENLRREVEALLNAAPVGEELFGSVVGHSLHSSDSGSEHPSEQPGSLIGRYKLLEKIGEGGMGVVYMAEQEEPVRRRVALKIIKLGMDTRQVIARFEAERQALAIMDSPHIAQVLDAGATESGRPYFVMELVQGVPITQFCSAKGLSIEERLQLFISVCHAIQSAHQKGVIHRDLKPSNVLVTLNAGVPHPMVIDFGVAKAINQKLTEKTLFTNFATMIGTPAYMSPEQAEMSKLDVDTRSDIYSLGVLLYELLTGSTPFSEERLRGVAYTEMQRIIVEEEPERPSTRLRKKTITQSEIRNPKSEIDPDLDWIVMKCLEKDRNRRYETANDLTADITRFLNSEPVVARPPSPAYRLQKFIRRNRTVSIAAAVVTFALMAGISVSSWALIRERAAREQSDRRLRSALRFVNEIFDSVAPEIRRVQGATMVREKLGQASWGVLEDLKADAADDAAVREALVKALIYWATIQGSIGEGNVSGDYEAGLQRALEAVDLLSSAPVEELPAAQLKSLVSANHTVAACLHGLGRYDEAVRTLQESIPWLVKLERFPEFSGFARARRMGNLASVGYYVTLAGDPKEGLQHMLPVLNSEWARSISTNSAESDIERLGNTYGQVTTAHLLLRDYGAMLESAEKNKVLQETLVQRSPGNVRHIGCRAANRSTRGFGLMHAGRAEEALEALRQSRAEIDGLAQKDPADEFVRGWVIQVAILQARAFAFWSEEGSAPFLDRQQRLAQAERYLAEAEELHKSKKANGSPLFWEAARADVATAKAKLEGDAGTKPKP